MARWVWAVAWGLLLLAAAAVEAEAQVVMVGAGGAESGQHGAARGCLRVDDDVTVCRHEGDDDAPMFVAVVQVWDLLECSKADGVLAQLRAAMPAGSHLAPGEVVAWAAAWAALAERHMQAPSTAACALAAAAVVHPTPTTLTDLCSALFMSGTHSLQVVHRRDLVEAAPVLCDAALRREPRLADAALVSGLAYTLLGNAAGSAAAYGRFAALLRPFPAPAPDHPLSLLSIAAVRQGLLWQLTRAMDPNFAFATALKLEHDAQQFRLLLRLGVLPHSFEPIVSQYEQLLAIAMAPPLRAQVAFRIPDAFPLVQATYGRNVFVRPTPALPKEALRPWDVAAIMREYDASEHGIAVVDDAFTDEAIAELLDFCEQSTIFHDDGFEAYLDNGTLRSGAAAPAKRGYLGAYLHEGFASELIMQIAEEMRAALPRVFKNHSLNVAWAYKYNASQAGINVHGDDAAVNCNCWITSDRYNRDAESGGMVVYDREAPSDWSFTDINANAVMVTQWLAQQQPPVRSVKVPHRQNRCVIFNSNLFHRTDHLNFEAGLRARRINLTFLFGMRQTNM